MHVQIPVIMAALLLGSTASAQNSSSQAPGTVKHQPEATVKEQAKQTKAPIKEEKLILADPTAGNKKEMTMAEYDAYRKKLVQEAAKKKQPAKQKPQVQFAPPVVKKDVPAEKPKQVKQDERPMVKFTPPVVKKGSRTPVQKVKIINESTMEGKLYDENNKDVTAEVSPKTKKVKLVKDATGRIKVYDETGKEVTELPAPPPPPFPPPPPPTPAKSREL